MGRKPYAFVVKTTAVNGSAVKQQGYAQYQVREVLEHLAFLSMTEPLNETEVIVRGEAGAELTLRVV